MKALAAEALAKRYEGVHALRGVDLDVETGECRVIIGPNGAGKTTLFHLLSGVTPPTTGRGASRRLHTVSGLLWRRKSSPRCRSIAHSRSWGRP